jgi:hypothetical protein
VRNKNINPPTPQELNRELVRRGLKALETGTMKVTIAEYLRQQHNQPTTGHPPPVWIEAGSHKEEDLYSPQTQ